MGIFGSRLASGPSNRNSDQTPFTGDQKPDNYRFTTTGSADAAVVLDKSNDANANNATAKANNATAKANNANNVKAKANTGRAKANANNVNANGVTVKANGVITSNERASNKMSSPSVTAYEVTPAARSMFDLPAGNPYISDTTPPPLYIADLVKLVIPAFVKGPSRSGGKFPDGNKIP